MVYRTCALIYGNRSNSVIGLFRTSSNHRPMGRCSVGAVKCATPETGTPLLSPPLYQRLCQREGAQRGRDPLSPLLFSPVFPCPVPRFRCISSSRRRDPQNAICHAIWTTVRFNIRVFTNPGTNLIEVLEHFRSENEL